jgi:hypothetical protein
MLSSLPPSLPEIEIVPPGCDHEPIQSDAFGEDIGSIRVKDDVGSHPVVQFCLRVWKD